LAYEASAIKQSQLLKTFEKERNNKGSSTCEQEGKQH